MHQAKLFEYGGRGVDVMLESKADPPEVFWTSTGNSYVLVRPSNESIATWSHPKLGKCHLISVNGIGEIRWVAGFGMLEDGDLEAVDAFGLDLASSDDPGRVYMQDRIDVWRSESNSA